MPTTRPFRRRYHLQMNKLVVVILVVVSMTPPFQYVKYPFISRVDRRVRMEK